MIGDGPTIVELWARPGGTCRTRWAHSTAHKRLLRWAVDGTWERILAALLAAADGADDIDWTVSVDSTVCRTHQHAAGARKKGRHFGMSPMTIRSDVPAAA